MLRPSVRFALAPAAVDPVIETDRPRIITGDASTTVEPVIETDRPRMIAGAAASADALEITADRIFCRRFCAIRLELEFIAKARSIVDAAAPVMYFSFK